MNPKKDDHVSFFAMRLVVSPDEKFMLVSTEASRMMVYRLDGMQLLQSIYGLPIETFHIPCACWHPKGFHIYVASAKGVICIFHVGTGRLVAKMKGHDANVRAMLFDPSQQALLSCGFDKKICIFKHASRIINEQP